jgi:hypothetical protein
MTALMKRAVPAALAAVVATVIVVATASAGSPPTPILIGDGPPSSEGFGKVKPIRRSNPLLTLIDAS